jgi:uncharacterized membrane protein YbhN (UPF0104 family)
MEPRVENEIKPRNAGQSRTRSAFKSALAVTILTGLLVWVGPRVLIDALAQITLITGALLLLLSALLVWVSAVKWRWFLRELRLPDASGAASGNLMSTGVGAEVPGTGYLSALYLLGYFVNLLAPSFVGGDAVRSYYVGRVTGQYQAAAATILERFTGLLAMLGLGVMVGWTSELVSAELYALVVGLAAGGVVVAWVSVHPGLENFIVRLPWGTRIARHVAAVQGTVWMLRRNHRLWWGTLGLSLVFHTLTVANTAAAAWAVGWVEVPLAELFVVLPIILLLGALPISPSGLGVQEGAFVFFLQGLGATPGQALGVALILRAKVYLLAVLGGLVFLSLRRKAPAPGVCEVGIDQNVPPKSNQA